jgi:hypothetical protein
MPTPATFLVNSVRPKRHQEQSKTSYLITPFSKQTLHKIANPPGKVLFSASPSIPSYLHTSRLRLAERALNIASLVPFLSTLTFSPQKVPQGILPHSAILCGPINEPRPARSHPQSTDLVPLFAPPSASHLLPGKFDHISLSPGNLLSQPSSLSLILFNSSFRQKYSTLEALCAIFTPPLAQKRTPPSITASLGTS